MVASWYMRIQNNCCMMARGKEQHTL